MDWLEALVLGVIQGLTEWLPVSSSGHLALGQRYLGRVPVAVDIMLHFGTMLVLFFYFRREARSAGRGARAILRDVSAGSSWKSAINKDAERKLAFLIVLAILPTAVLGLAFRFLFGESLFENLYLVAAGFAATGVVLTLSAFYRKGNRRTGDLTVRDSLAVGTAQGIAFLPGFSRSGLTISAGMFGGMEGETAGRYSFLIMLPAVLGSMIFSIPDLKGLPGADLLAGLAGMAVAMLVGYASLGALMRILKKGGLHYFAPYCFVACVVTVLVITGTL